MSDQDLCYCKDKDRQGFMICCERCDIWYHYRCINTDWDLPLNRRQVRNLVNYYCYPCRRANPLLKMKYYSSENFGLSTPNQDNEMIMTQTKHNSTSSLLREQSTSNNQQQFLVGDGGNDGSTIATNLKQRTRTLSRSIGNLANDVTPMRHEKQCTSTATSATTTTISTTAIEKQQHQRSESINVSPSYSGYSTSWASSISTMSSPSLRSRSPPSSSPSPPISSRIENSGIHRLD